MRHDSDVSTDNESVTTRFRFRFRKRRIAALVLLAMTAALLHQPILHLAARPLVVEDEFNAMEYVWVTKCDRCFDRAAELVRSGQARRVLIVEQDATRLTKLGILPEWADVARRELDIRGVVAEQITVVRQAGTNPWHWARSAHQWTRSQEPLSLVVLCDRFHSRDQQLILRAKFSARQFHATSLLALPNRRFDETNWWRSRTGVKAFFAAHYSLVYDWAIGEPMETEWQWDPDLYEKALKERLAEPLERA